MKFYAVKRGKEGPNIYTDWSSCKSVVKGFPGAKFKSFKTEEEAQKYLDEKEDILKEVPKEGIFVDGASSLKNNTWEYRLVFSNGSELYRSEIFSGGTNNTGEFLAIVKALQLCKENNWDYIIYSDSVCGISWVNKKEVNSKSSNTSTETQRMLLDAITWLKENSYSNKIVHWSSKILNKQIFADFGRK